MAISDSINALPSYQRWAILAFLLIVFAGVFIWMVYIPKQQQIVALNKEIGDLNAEIQVNKEKANKLDTLKKEKAEAERQLAALQRELPVEAEATALLKQIAELGVKSGLDFQLWRPSAPHAGSGGLYVEFPVDVQIAGGYHALAGFFDLIGHLERIVNVTNIKMNSAKIGKNDELVIQTSFVATAFAASTAKPPAPKEAG